jgi:hypothetical protein
LGDGVDGGRKEKGVTVVDSVVQYTVVINREEFKRRDDELGGRRRS